VMEYIAEYIQNQYHDEFIIRKWIYLSNNYMNEEELPYEDLMIHTILFWIIKTKWTTEVIWDLLFNTNQGILISLWGQLVLAIRGAFHYYDPAKE